MTSNFSYYFMDVFSKFIVIKCSSICLKQIIFSKTQQFFQIYLLTTTFCYVSTLSREEGVAGFVENLRSLSLLHKIKGLVQELIETQINDIMNRFMIHNTEKRKLVKNHVDPKVGSSKLRQKLSLWIYVLFLSTCCSKQITVLVFLKTIAWNSSVVCSF